MSGRPVFPMLNRLRNFFHNVMTFSKLAKCITILSKVIFSAKQTFYTIDSFFNYSISMSK